jgi:hypothetical protein
MSARGLIRWVEEALASLFKAVEFEEMIEINSQT